MNPSETSTHVLISIAKRQVSVGNLDDAILRELQSRFAYQNCPPAEKAAIVELDRQVLIPHFGFTKLPSEPIQIPGTRRSPAQTPSFYQKQRPKEDQHPSGDPSEQAISILRQFVESSGSDLICRDWGEGQWTLQVDDLCQVEVTEPRFIQDDLDELVALDLLRTEFASDGKPTPVIRVLDFAQKYTGSIRWEDFDIARSDLQQTNAFRDSTEAEDHGVRLVLPKNV